METYLAKLPKDMLIEIIKKGFDWKDLPDEQLHKTFFKIRDVLIHNMTEKLKNNEEIILWKNDNEKITIEGKYLDDNIAFFFIEKGEGKDGKEDEDKSYILKIDMASKLIYGTIYGTRVQFSNFAHIVEIIENTLAIRFPNRIKIGDIDYSSLKQVYDKFSTWNEIRPHSASIQ